MVGLTATIAPLLGGLFLVLGAGVLFRALRTAELAHADADALNRVILDVTVPALLVSVLAHRDLAWHAAAAVVPSTVALVVAAAAGLGVATLLHATRPARGAALLSSGFCNTGYLGVPLLIALFPGDAAASSTAIFVDTFDTTILLWTVGVVVAQRFGAGASARPRSFARDLVRPITIALVVGVLIHTFHVELPAVVDGALDAVGKCTTPLVFLALGLQLDVKAIRGHASLVGAVAVIKLALSPMVALVVARAMHLAEPIASVAVLQAGMPSAMASGIVAARTGCDRSVAAGAIALSTLLCLVSLPAVGWLLDVTR